MVSFAISAIPIGWLADRYGPAKIAVVCGILTGAGLILTSNISALWQIYLTYGVMVGIGLSGSYPIVTATIARWFIKRRGLALGIVSAGYGIGTLAILPLTERLIATYGWSQAYLIFGSFAVLLIIACALFLRRDPRDTGRYPYGATHTPSDFISYDDRRRDDPVAETSVTFGAAARTATLWMVMAIYFLIFFSVQIVMVHLVNYTTDMGIVPLVAASLVSVIGASSVVGRLLMGAAADRIGSNNAIIICCVILTITLVWLLFAKELWMLYIFAITFGFAYGGEVPQMPSLISRYFGLRSVTALVGAVSMASAFGGAISAWMAGRIFDFTQSYSAAFAIAAAAGLLALLIALLLKRK
jgi:MFS family permease